MSAAGPPSQSASAFAEVRGIVAAWFRLTGGFWSGPTRVRAWFLTLALAAALVSLMGVNVFANRWQGWFFDALAKRDTVGLWWAVSVLPLLVVATAAVGVAIVLARETLQVRWREWITRMLLGRWLSGARFARLKDGGDEPANPEYRIADDVRIAIEPITDLVIGFVTAILQAVAFISILWSLGGSIALGGVTIPAYFVLAALAYGVCASGLVMLIGRSLVWKVASRNEAEAVFRARLTLTRDRAEAIVAARADAAARTEAEAAYETVVARWLRVVRQHGHITWITNANAPTVASVPLLLAAPKYLAGDLSIGDVVRIAAAFAAVQGAISWLVDNFRILAIFAASARRVTELAEAVERVSLTEANAAARILILSPSKDDPQAGATAPDAQSTFVRVLDHPSPGSR